MKKSPRGEGLLWVLLGAALCIGSIQLKLGTLGEPGAGFLPFLTGASLAGFGLLLKVSNVLSATSREGQGPVGEVRPASSWYRLLRPALAVAILLVYVLLLEPLGFLLTTFICLFFLFKLSEPRKWRMPLLISGTTAALSYLLFSVLLQCQLPKGLLRFW